MADPLQASLAVSTSGLAAQTERMRVISQNIANVNTTGSSEGADPYFRKTISFVEALGTSSGVASVKVKELATDTSAFTLVHDPNHVAADENGMVKMPKINMLMEMADLRETIRSYEANVQAAKQARQLISMTIDMMRS